MTHSPQLPRLLEPPVVCRECSLEGVSDRVADLPAEERRTVESAVAKRRREFVAGRTLARAALLELGFADAVVPQRQDRSPEWPVGVVGSISHTRDRCGVAVARASDLQAIGVDLEGRGPLSPAVIARVCVQSELERLGADLSSELEAKVLFSAKESVFKAQWPLTGAFLEFTAVEVEVRTNGTWVARFVEGCRPSGLTWDRVEGRWSCDASTVATAVVVDRSPG